MKITYIFLTVLFLQAPFAFSEEPRPLMQSDFSIEGQKYTFKLHDIDLKDAPDWKMGEEEPAISPNEAYLLAKKKLDEILPGLDSPKTHGISLSRFPGWEGKYSTYYNINFYSSDIDIESMGSISSVNCVSFIVLLDGRVIAPKKLLQSTP